MFDSPIKLLLGFITGIAFGFLLQKGQAAKYRVIMGQLFLKDWTVLKIMLTAVVVGSIGVWVLVNSGAATLHIKPAAVGGVLFGGLLFGIGIAIFGLCPGTSVAACGEGHRDAVYGVVGMLFGAGAYVVGYAAWQPMVKAFVDWGKVTLPEVTQTSPWLWVMGLIIVGALLAWLLEKNGPLLRRRQHASTLNFASQRFLGEGGGMTLPTAQPSRQKTALMFRSGFGFLFVVLLCLTATPAQACPVCDSETGKDVRRGLFNEDFGKNLLMTVLPFPILSGIVALIYYGPPRPERTKE